jgi:transposase-like protein
MHCPKCGSEKAINFGKTLNRQRKLCKQCGCQYTRPDIKGKPPQYKAIALELYLSGLSFNRIAQLLHVSDVAVLKWIKAELPKSQRRPEAGKATVVELDELCTFLAKKNAKFGFGWLFVEKQDAFWIGKWVVAELKP